MLAVTSYKPDYTPSLKAADSHFAAYRKLARAAPGPELEAFRNSHFQMLVLALDHQFLHRLRNAEGKDGGPATQGLCARLRRRLVNP